MSSENFSVRLDNNSPSYKKLSDKDPDQGRASHMEDIPRSRSPKDLVTISPQASQALASEASRADQPKITPVSSAHSDDPNIERFVNDIKKLFGENIIELEVREKEIYIKYTDSADYVQKYILGICKPEGNIKIILPWERFGNASFPKSYIDQFQERLEVEKIMFAWEQKTAKYFHLGRNEVGINEDQFRPEFLKINLKISSRLVKDVEKGLLKSGVKFDITSVSGDFDHARMSIQIAKKDMEQLASFFEISEGPKVSWVHSNNLHGVRC